MEIQRVWAAHSEKLHAALEICGIYKPDICAIWLGSKELVLRKSWNGNLMHLQEELKKHDLTRPLTVRFETLADTGEQLDAMVL
uniref:Uncharacterized protein n=1 Tax=viral metagenome TaxID=1070528 RepID=A0A6C0CK27_9ZZZZ